MEEVNWTLVDFYRLLGPDTNGRWLDQMIEKNDLWWETTHDFIQWVFPTSEASRFNKESPLLNESTIKELIDPDYFLPSLLGQSLLRFSRFLELDKFQPWWLYESKHNHLRLTRCLTSLCELQQPELARILWNQMYRLVVAHPGLLVQTMSDHWLPIVQKYNI